MITWACAVKAAFSPMIRGPGHLRRSQFCMELIGGQSLGDKTSCEGIKDGQHVLLGPSINCSRMVLGTEGIVEYDYNSCYLVCNPKIVRLLLV